MINITYIVPYPELEDLVYKCFEAHPQRDIVNHNISVISADNLEEATFQCDVLIARGYTAKKLNRLMPNIPQIEVHITGYDIIKAVEECRIKFNPKKIGFVGEQSIINSVNKLLGLFNCEIDIYIAQELTDIKTTLHHAIEDGCDAIISGNFVNSYAKEMNINSNLIKTGEEAITQALNEAIRTVEVMRQERAKTEIFQTIAQCSHDGIIYITFNGQIEAINKMALKMCTDKH
jgi:PAS domain-containing protein